MCSGLRRLSPNGRASAPVIDQLSELLRQDTSGLLKSEEHRSRTCIRSTKRHEITRNHTK